MTEFTRPVLLPLSKNLLEPLDEAVAKGKAVSRLAYIRAALFIALVNDGYILAAPESAEPVVEVSK